MAVLRDSKEIYVCETEKRPNQYAANVLSGVVGVMIFVNLFNEIGIFTLNKILVRVSFLVALAMFLAIQLLVRRERWISSPSSKYIVFGMVLFLVFVITVLLNIHAVLAFVLPLLLATQYRSHRVSLMALIGSCFCCLAAPVLSYLLSTWNLDFMIGYVTTFCHVTVSTSPGNDLSTASAVWQIFLYWSLPQTLTLCAFGLILYSATKSGIDSVTNQIQVNDLSNDLNYQLESLLAMQEKVLYSMSDIIESRDIETGGHVRRTSEIVRLLMNAMRADPESGVSEEFCSNVIKSAPMHDLGKIAVSDMLLRKPGRLTPEEFEAVKQHPVKSAEIIKQALTGIEDEKLLDTAKNIAKYHHERYDGSGYPDGLRGGAIPLEARIMAIADVYDALVSERCYKAPMAFDEAFETIEASMGTHFDPALNRYFVTCRDEIEEYYRI